MEITLRTTSGAHALIAKAFASDGLDIYQAMKRISRAGFGPEAEFSIPQALDFLPALHLLLPLFPGAEGAGRDLVRKRSSRYRRRWISCRHCTFCSRKKWKVPGPRNFS